MKDNTKDCLEKYKFTNNQLDELKYICEKELLQYEYDYSNRQTSNHDDINLNKYIYKYE